jgi:hypothetical protein
VIAGLHVMLHCGIYNHYAAASMKDFMFGIFWAGIGAWVAIWQYRRTRLAPEAFLGQMPSPQKRLKARPRPMSDFTS